MAKVLFLLFMAMPIIEIALLLEVGERIGPWQAIGLIVATALLGAALVRQQGISTLLEARRRAELGQVPGQQMAEGLLLLMAGVLLVTPGFVTDAIGLLLALPVTRPVLAAWLLSRWQWQVVSSVHGRYQQGHYQDHYGQPRHTFEGEFDVRTAGDDESLQEKRQLPPR